MSGVWTVDAPAACIRPAHTFHDKEQAKSSLVGPDLSGYEQKAFVPMTNTSRSIEGRCSSHAARSEQRGA